MTSLAGLLLLSACSGGAADDPGAAANDAPAVVADATMPKAGLWRMTISGDGLPGGMAVQTCLGAPAAGSNPFAPPSQPGQQCTTPAPTRTTAGYAVDISCRMNGITIVSKGTVTGDFASRYRTVMKTRMSGPGIPAAAQAERTSVVEAEYRGPCPAGMKPGATTRAG